MGGGQGAGKLECHGADQAAIGVGLRRDAGNGALDSALGCAESTHDILGGGLEVAEGEGGGDVGLDVDGADDVVALVVAFGDSESVEGALAEPGIHLGRGQGAGSQVVVEAAAEVVDELALLRAGDVEGDAVEGGGVEDKSGCGDPRSSHCGERDGGSSCVGGSRGRRGENQVGGGPHDPESGVVDVEVDEGDGVAGVEGYRGGVGLEGDSHR